MKDIVMINTPTALQVQPPPESWFYPFLAGTYGVKLELVRLGVPLSVSLPYNFNRRPITLWIHHLSQGGTFLFGTLYCKTLFIPHTWHFGFFF